MRMHETLYLIQGLHDFIAREVANKGDWCWPTRELLAENLAANKAVLGTESGFREQLSLARRRGWLSEGPCQSHCHARHVRLTASGMEMLRLLDEAGCCPSCRVPDMRERERGSRRRGCRIDSLKFHRKVAA